MALQAQTIINVPDDLHPTIQVGIDSAKDGNIVLVAENHYFEQVRFKGKKIILASHFYLDGNPAHIGNTIIDGDSIANTDSASVVYFTGTCDTNSVLCGFTIQHGKGTRTTDNFDYRQGGGIWITHCGAKIIHNRIIDNTLDDMETYGGQSVAGGGIGAFLGDSSFTVVIRDNLIDKNNCNSWYLNASGGGISISCNALIENNIITNNMCYSYQVARSYGGGISCTHDNSWTYPAEMIIRGNNITNNLVQSQAKWANGAGIKAQSVKVIITENMISGNNVMVGPNISINDGFAGIMIVKPDRDCLIARNTISENTSGQNAGGLGLFALSTDPAPETVQIEDNFFIGNHGGKGGGLSSIGNPVKLINNVFSGNCSTGDGGGIYVGGRVVEGVHHHAVLVNNSFSGNTANGKGGAIYTYFAEPLIFNSVFFNDSAGGLRQEIFLETESDTLEIASSLIDLNLIKGGSLIDGGDNVDGDPVFTDPVWLTTDESSSAYNVGVPAFTCMCGESNEAPECDIQGNPRPWYGEFDMGAYEFQAPVGFLEHSRVRQKLLCTVYPNPFRESVDFRYVLCEPARVALTVMNGMGQTVAVPAGGFQEGGEYNVQWNAVSFPAGMYYYRLVAGTTMCVGKICKY